MHLALAPSRSALGTLDVAIVQAVVYSSLFEYPLTLAELRDTLVGAAGDKDKILARYRTSGALQATVEYESGFFFPKGQRTLVDERRRREARSRELLHENRRTLKLIASLPFTRLVALSGSIAHLNVNGHGDIDLFIVTRKRRVWLVTVAAVLLSKLLRSRSAICLNFVVSDRQLEARQPDLFTANQIVHLKPLIGDEVLGELVDRNEFVFDFYPNFFPPAGTHPMLAPGVVARGLKRCAEWILAPGPGRLLEALCHRLYERHLRAQAGSWRSPDQVALEAEYLKLHTHSHRALVLERFDRETARAFRSLAGA
ncbi:MAG: hypothetical protein HYZ58_14235 [Acidobacteria bacterium]|nr:hypothetical protein [Acidobacteriota bacterium]MBI3264291.1 hypothetical protein [Acidobacteriota bacterium]